MTILQRFADYAQAFEETFADDDWSRIEPYFTEDSSYAFGDENATGRSAVMEMLRGSVNGLDRQMDSRTGEFSPPSAEGNTVHMDWKVTYAKAGLPDLVIAGHETAEFQGDRILRLRDELTPQGASAMATWMAAHGAKLTG